MPEYLSNYAESDVAAHLDKPLTDEEIDHFQDKLPPDGQFVIREALRRIDSDPVSGAICYLGRSYNTEDGAATTLSWAGFRLTKRAIERAIDLSVQGRPAILTSRREVSEALSIGRLVTPSRWQGPFAGYPPITVVAWYLKESVTGLA